MWTWDQSSAFHDILREDNPLEQEDIGLYKSVVLYEWDSLVQDGICSYSDTCAPKMESWMATCPDHLIGVCFRRLVDWREMPVWLFV